MSIKNNIVTSFFATIAFAYFTPLAPMRENRENNNNYPIFFCIKTEPSLETIFETYVNIIRNFAHHVPLNKQAHRLKILVLENASEEQIAAVTYTLGTFFAQKQNRKVNFTASIHHYRCLSNTIGIGLSGALKNCQDLEKIFAQNINNQELGVYDACDFFSDNIDNIDESKLDDFEQAIKKMDKETTVAQQLCIFQNGAMIDSFSL